ncbi:BRO-N domain-containing protein, partial [Cetobacterium sp.]|uniref:BRO-N domain-containing protein n=1 Tax=Cetobacterium sp. TaxID=2071632 RepID=UPI003EE5C5CF
EKEMFIFMNNLNVFEKREILGKEFNMYADIENPLFLARDVASWIEHTDLSRMVSMVDDEEKLKRTIYVAGQNREMWFLTEDGLYEVLMQSRKPIAKTFKKEVKKILKEIRLTGVVMLDREQQLTLKVCSGTATAQEIQEYNSIIENRGRKMGLVEGVEIGKLESINTRTEDKDFVPTTTMLQNLNKKLMYKGEDPMIKLNTTVFHRWLIFSNKGSWQDGAFMPSDKFIKELNESGLGVVEVQSTGKKRVKYDESYIDLIINSPEILQSLRDMLP